MGRAHATASVRARFVLSVLERAEQEWQRYAKERCPGFRVDRGFLEAVVAFSPMKMTAVFKDDKNRYLVIRDNLAHLSWSSIPDVKAALRWVLGESPTPPEEGEEAWRKALEKIGRTRVVESGQV